MYNAINYLPRSKLSTLVNKVLKNDATKTIKDVFFRIPFHPSHPTSKIKPAWKNCPNSIGKIELSQLTTEEGYPFPGGKFIVCYHKALNLGNLFSYFLLTT